MARSVEFRSRALARRLLYGACGLSVVVCVVVFFVTRTSDGAVGLRIDAGGEGDHVLVGEAMYFGVPLTATGQGTVKILNASVVGIPPGLDILAVGATQADAHQPGRRRFIGAESEAALRIQFPLFRMVALHDVLLAPSTTGGSGWELIVVVRATQPGHFVTTGLSVKATQNGASGTVTGKFALDIDAMDPSARIDMSRPVRLLADCPGSEAPIPQTWQGLAERGVAAGGGEAVVKVDLTNTSEAWNTSDGQRPTQQMVDSGFRPALYQVERLEIERVLAGHLPTGAATGLLLGGESGSDSQGGCAPAIDPRTDGPEFLVIFGPHLPYDQQAQQPVLEVRDLAAVSGNVAATPYGAVTIPS